MLAQGSVFEDRDDAGRQLADAIEALNPARPIVFALPRGGVPVAAIVAERLGAPLELLIVRKIGAPYQPELAVGAVVDDGAPDIVLNDPIVAATGMTQKDIDRAVQRERDEIKRRRSLYGIDDGATDLSERTAIVVDDGIATGATVQAGLRALKRRRPAELVLAVPVAPSDTLTTLARLCDRIVCLSTPEPFQAVGCHYRNFAQLSDDDVIRLLKDRRPQ